MTILGTPCWYELMTAPGGLDAADRFYCGLFGWSVADAGMEGFTYHLAKAGDDMVAGLMEPMPGMEGMHPFWMVYFATPDAEATLEAVRQGGGRVVQDLNVIPGTGRFAICGDPQGAGFGILEPEAMADGPPTGRAYARGEAGHATWHDLMTHDPEAAQAFYGAVFGWTPVRSVDQGEAGPYTVMACNGDEFGGIMRQGASPMPIWLPYFAVADADATAEAATSAGGGVIAGPTDAPGGMRMAVTQDPHSAAFAVLSRKER